MNTIICIFLFMNEIGFEVFPMYCKTFLKGIEKLEFGAQVFYLHFFI